MMKILVLQLAGFSWVKIITCAKINVGEEEEKQSGQTSQVCVLLHQKLGGANGNRA